MNLIPPLCLYQGQFIGVAGQVGSGKSSLLFAILAELEKHTGIVATSELENGLSSILLLL